ncbi:molybdate ABC transporter permease subunit [Paenibacillus sepulcri]|uniref:Molybdenum transport system permease n=1 Tax=Paenibacillus sepulcri TaxID=359917 RepID=A0ABS7BX39_9BACL|nr:molybdate ABC transporter permease subunit [Paenibacillus sepulcri]
MTINWHDFISPVLLSLKIGFVSSIAVFLLGTAAAWLMTIKRFYGKTLVETAFLLPLVLPPTVVGFVLLIVIGRRGWVGELFERLFDNTLVFTWWAGVLASIVISFPLVYMTIKTGFLSIDKDLQDASRSIGAGEWQVLLWVTLPLSARALVSGYILGFARGLGEFGATIMVAGNIPGKTQTVPTAIYVAVDNGKTMLAWYWVISIVITSFFMLLIANLKRN